MAKGGGGGLFLLTWLCCYINSSNLITLELPKNGLKFIRKPNVPYSFSTSRTTPASNLLRFFLLFMYWKTI